MTPAEARVVEAMSAAGLEPPKLGEPIQASLNRIADGIEQLHAELGRALVDRVKLSAVAEAAKRVLHRWERIKAAGGSVFEIDPRPEGALSLREALDAAGFPKEARP